MKKIIALFVCLIMIVAMAVSSVSAAGQILFKDEFNSMDNNDWIWDPEATHFIVQDGVLKGDNTARVHQTEYRPDYDGIRLWDYFACKVDVRITDYVDSASMGPGLWWRDYNTTFEQEDAGETDDGEIWNFKYDQVSNTCILSSEYFERNNIESIVVPAPIDEVKIGPDDKPTTFTIGWRIQPGRIDCYFNDQKVITCTQVPADIGSIRKSPILLLNEACYLEFDNFTVSTPDYNLFNESPDDVNNNGGDTQAPATKIVEKIEKGENGETRIVTEIVADTNANTPSASNGGSSTGDMIVVIAAVMTVAAAGSIVVAKKRNEN